MRNNCVYFVEGKCEATLISALKEYPPRILAGRIRVFNVVANLIPRSQLIAIQANSTVVFVFDTDVPITDTLKKNIELIDRYCTRVKILYLPQVINLEDELVRCTDIKRIAELTGSKSSSNFKSDFCALSNCRSVLDRHKLDVAMLWTPKLPDEFTFVEHNSGQVKLP